LPLKLIGTTFSGVLDPPLLAASGERGHGIPSSVREGRKSRRRDYPGT
jgi:hypothetical protein